MATKKKAAKKKTGRPKKAPKISNPGSVTTFDEGGERPIPLPPNPKDPNPPTP